MANVGESIVIKFLHCEGIKYAFSSLQNMISLAESLPSDMQLSYINNLSKKFLDQLDLLNYVSIISKYYYYISFIRLD